MNKSALFFYALISVTPLTQCRQATVTSQPLDSDEEICTLAKDKKTFTCDMEFPQTGGSCKVSESLRKRFIERMTEVSLQMLYLDQERGGEAPYLYNDLGSIAKRVNVVKCSGSCICRMSFADPNLDEILYDAAGCRKSSKFVSNPLFFRATGCH